MTTSIDSILTNMNQNFPLDFLLDLFLLSHRLPSSCLGFASWMDIYSSFLEPWTAAEVTAELSGISSAARKSESLVAPRRRALPDLPVGIAEGLKDGIAEG